MIFIHKQVQQLGRATAKRIQTDFNIGPSVGALLKLVADPAARVRVLDLVDSGQRSRVDAQLSALAHELPWDTSR